MADGLYYNDLRAPFVFGDIASVTLATTNKALYPVANFPVLGGNYFAFLGKKLKIKMFGRITTAATPGNGQWNVYWGNGTDANGTILASSGTLALSINQTNVSWCAEFSVYCRAPGGAGVGNLMCTGWSLFNVGVLASTLQPMLIPATAPAGVSVDLTAANIVSVQFLRSGSTAESMQVHDLDVVAMN
jgi:hypothetical protein